MTLVVLRTISRLHLHLITIASLFLLLRGHNEPGGGFIAGLMTSVAIVLQALAFDAQYAARLIPIRESKLLAMGLSLALGTGLFAAVIGRPFLDHVFQYYTIPLYGEIQISTAVIFDIGVYLVVVGATKWIILTLAQEEDTG